MPKPPSILQLEQATGLSLSLNPDLAKSMLHRHRNSWAEDAEGRVAALNLLDNPELTRLVIPPELATSLQFLHVSGCPKLTEVVLPAAELPLLQKLDLSECGLTRFELPGTCPRLHWLDLRKNQLASLEVRGDCPALRYLDLSDNQLAGAWQLPRAFRTVQHLYLNGNQLVAFQFEVLPIALETLHLRGNQLAELPPGLLTLLDKHGLESLYLHGNPLPRVPKGETGVPEGDNAEYANAASNIHLYLIDITEDRAMPNDEVKLVLLGNSTAGKTNLLHFLRTGKYEPDIHYTTHGLSNKPWEPESLGFLVNAWDFGGQEFYFATHRFFLTKNAVYLVVFEQKTNYQGESELPMRVYRNNRPDMVPMFVEHFPFTYWLENLDYWCKNHHPHTLLAQSKSDEGERVPAAAESAAYGIGEERIFQVSALGAARGDKKCRRDFDSFLEELLAALDKAKATFETSEKSLLIKNDLRMLQDATKTLTWEDYAALCEKRRTGISEAGTREGRSVLDHVTDYLNEVGVILYFRDIPALDSTVFVKPLWVAELIYQVLDYEVMKNGGKFSRTHVEEVAPANLGADKLLELMKKFELIFPVDGTEGQYVAPQYLPRKKPWDDDDFIHGLADECSHLLFRLRFPKFLPPGVMTGFMCKYGPLSKSNHWRYGILFNKDGIRSLVECHPETRTITARCDREGSPLAAELFDSLCGIARNHPEIEVTAREDGLPVALRELQSKEERASGYFRATNGQDVSMADFAHLTGHGLFGKEGRIGKPHVEIQKPSFMDSINQFISRNQLDEALNHLSAHFPKEEHRVAALRGQLKELKSEEILGTISFSEKNQRRNQIVKAILDLAAECVETARTAPPSDSPKNMAQPAAAPATPAPAPPAKPSKVKIFLASSAELHPDRVEFERFIYRETKNLHDKGIFLELVQWEDFLAAMSATRLQDEYNQAVRGCDLFVSLFFTKTGKYTREEFDAAFDQFKKTGKPRIFTYFKKSQVDSDSITEEFMSLVKFKNELKDLGHFPTPYESTGDLKHEFGEQLKKLGIQ